MNSSGGKGSARRPSEVSSEQIANNWETIFGKKKKQVGLIDGKIPPNTDCPYKEKCEIFQSQKCHHQGLNHTTAFSCAVARAFELSSSSQ